MIYDKYRNHRDPANGKVIRPPRTGEVMKIAGKRKNSGGVSQVNDNNSEKVSFEKKLFFYISIGSAIFIIFRTLFN